jgi:hypothetical protein
MPIPSPTDETNYFIKKGYKPKGEKVCECCGKIIILYLNRDFKRKRFCSRQCFGKVNAKINNLKPGRPSKETYKKIGEILSLKMKSGLIPKPPKPTPESREKAASKMRGEKHFRWIKDRSKLKRTRFDNSFRNEGPIASWRSGIFKRDRFTCQKCHQVGGKLNAHHIKSWADFPELRFDMSNGVTLCVNCHKEIHKKCH